MKHKSLRYNAGKERLSLLPNSIKHVVEVYQKGAHKYSTYKINDEIISGKDVKYEDIKHLNPEVVYDGSNNWKLGASWTQTIEAVERHISRFKSMSDRDNELGTYHLANATWGLLALLEYYEIYPEGDDREIPSLLDMNIGLDIDGVLADFNNHFLDYLNIEDKSPCNHWRDPRFSRNFRKIVNDEKFWSTIPPLVDGKTLHFEPCCYITSRPVDSNITEEWLDRHGFPVAPVITVGVKGSKVQACIDQKVQVFVDDHYDNYKDITKNTATLCLLMDRSHNRKHNVGNKRIKSLEEIK